MSGKHLKEIVIREFRNARGGTGDIHLFYQFFGQDPRDAPIVLVAHSLTGNSGVTGENGWWRELVGPGKTIDTDTYCVLSINMPGNGAGGEQHLLHNYRDFNLQDMAGLFVLALRELKIESLFAAVGGSIGGALLWHLAVLEPNLIRHLIPIATDIRSTDWLLAHCRVQETILTHSEQPVRDARMHAMAFYRNPRSFSSKFNGRKNEHNQRFEVENWLEFHGDQLHHRFHLASYKLMNHLLTTIDISGGEGQPWDQAALIVSNICLVGIDSDLLFPAEEIRETYHRLTKVKSNVTYKEITSIHGHDAFLIEYPQLEQILNPIFNPQTQHENDQYCTVRNR